MSELTVSETTVLTRCAQPEAAGRVFVAPRGRQRRPWSAAEMRVIRTFARATLRGMFPSIKAACRGYLARLPMLRRRYPEAHWIWADRNISTVEKVLSRAMHKMGYTGHVVYLTKEEKRLLDALARQLANGRIAERQQAAQLFVETMNRRHEKYPTIQGYQPRRKLKTVATHIGWRANRLGWVKCPRFAPEENAIFRRYAEALLRGEYRSATAAVNPCRAELRELYERNADRLWSNRGLADWVVKHRVGELAHEIGGLWSCTPWSEAEDKVVRRHAQALVKGRHPHAEAATQACRAELDRLRERYPARARYTARRTRRGVERLIIKYARAAGYAMQRPAYSRAEWRLVRTYGKKLAQGRYNSGKEAACDLLREVSRRRAADPQLTGFEYDRPVVSLACRIAAAATRLGHRNVRYTRTDVEKELFERCVQRLVAQPGACILDLARKYLAERAALARRYPAQARLRWPATPEHTATLIARRARELGWQPVTVPMSTEEKAILDRHVRELVAGRHETRGQAVRSCCRELDELHEQRPDEPWARRKRTLGAIRWRMEYLLHSATGAPGA